MLVTFLPSLYTAAATTRPMVVIHFFLADDWETRPQLSLVAA